jgi:ribosomal protein S5
VMSFRILLTIGNLRGVGGYGMGKGSSPQQALNSAFRSLLP